MNLERQIVGFIPRRFLAAALPSAVAAAVSVITAAATTTAAAVIIAAAAQEMHIAGVYFQRIAGLPIAVGVAAPAQPPLDIYLPAFGKVLVADVTQPAKGAYLEPFGLLPLLTLTGSVAAA